MNQVSLKENNEIEEKLIFLFAMFLYISIKNNISQLVFLLTAFLIELTHTFLRHHTKHIAGGNTCFVRMAIIISNDHNY